MRRVSVTTGRPYEIAIERGCHEKLAEHLGTYKHRRMLILSDRNTRSLFADAIGNALQTSGYDVGHYTVQGGEGSKSLTELAGLLEHMATHAYHRDAILLAVGGGVIGDLGGFAASAYLRGIDFIQVPTTLLAAVDSSVGGKTGVNLEAGKNLVGAFHQPFAVWLDPTALASLPEDEWKSGVAETLKYGVLQDESLFDRVARGMTAHDEDVDAIIETCVRIKAQVVAADEKDHGIRQTLNLGHTFGHAIEAASRYEIPHGHAVAIGMAMMARACQKRGICTQETVQKIEGALIANGLPIHSPYAPNDLIGAMKKDKKASGTSIHLIVIETIGKCRIQKEPMEDLIHWLEDAQ